MNEERALSIGEEIANRVTHGVGMIAFAIGLPILVATAAGPISRHVPFFAWERLRYAHTVWHLFVHGGSACHFVAVLRYAAQAGV